MHRTLNTHTDNLAGLLGGQTCFDKQTAIIDLERPKKPNFVSIFGIIFLFYTRREVLYYLIRFKNWLAGIDHLQRY